jgi:acetoin utilization protein AcuC
MDVLVIRDASTAAYGFSGGHPFGPDRHDAFHAELARSGVAARVMLREGRLATREEIVAFHDPDYADRVVALCADATGFLDGGDTPAERGLDVAAAAVVGASVSAMHAIMRGEARHAFVPIAGLHHAGRDHASGFCVLNDCGVVIELLRSRYGLKRIAYVDIDAHHGDGIFYAYESDPDLAFADIHEDGRYLYPGTGAAHETGQGAARGTKLNLPLPPGAGDAEFREAWPRVEALLESARPEFIVFQCGADSIGGDPLTHLALTPAAHGHAAARLRILADRLCQGRLLATGGGGYDRRNLALAWTAVVRALASDDPAPP